MSVFPTGRRFALVMLLVAGTTARAQSPLEVIPADAKAVFLVNNLERTMQGSEKFAQAIGEPAPPADLSQLTQFMGELGSHWKVNRGVAVAMIQPGQDGLIAVFPVEDGAAALKAAKAEMKGEFGSFDMFGTNVVGTARGKNLLVSAGEASLKAFSSDKSLASALSPAQQKLAEQSAVFVYLNVQQLKPLIDQGLAEGDKLKELFDRIAEKNKQFNAEQAVMITKRIVQLLGEHAKSVYISLQIDEKAAVQRFGVELLPGSKGLEKLAAYKASSNNLFASLPQSNFVAAFGLDAAALTGLAGKNDGEKVNGISGALTLEKDAGVVMFRVDSPDAAKINEKLRGGVGALQFFLAGRGDGKVEFANSQKKVGGTDVGDVTVKFKGDNQKAQKVVAAVFGGNELHLQHGIVGPAVGITVSGKADAFSSLQAGGSLGASDRLKAAVGMLPANSAFVLLVDPVNALQIAKRVVRATGEESPLATADIPESGGFPVGAALSIEPDGFVFHVAIPSAAIKDAAPTLKKLD